MAYNLLLCDREQAYLMPPSLREWLPEGDLAWFILEAVGQMNLGELDAAYRNDGWGAAADDPAMMVGVLLDTYCQGIRNLVPEVDQTHNSVVYLLSVAPPARRPVL